jgi:hypothetical protein
MWCIYTDKDGDYVVHFMPTDVTANYHATVRMHKVGDRIVETLNYAPLTGTVKISGEVKGAKLYSADLEEVKEFAASNGSAEISLENLKRFFSVKVKR